MFRSSSFVVESLERRALLASVPVGFTDETVISGLSGITSLKVLPDGRWLVTEKAGRLRVVKNGNLLATPALTVSTENTSERGLLAVEADPNFASNGYVYVFYTPSGTGTKGNRVSRFRLVGDQASGGETVLMTLSNLSSAGNHNGGAMHFGPDGKLYIATGENANPPQAQQLTNTHGKMLRINADGTIPTNPFSTQTSGVNRAIWAYGLRNPFTFAFHPTTGKMHINDVGQSTYEEINVGEAGANYGWPTTEGPTTNPQFKAPLHYYGRSVGEAITGGVFYAGGAQQFPESYRNDYFFADFDSNWIKVLDSATNQRYDFATSASRIIDFDVLPDGSLLYSSYSGTIGRISYDANASLRITDQPDDLTRSVGQSATFTVQAASNQPITYQWLRNGQPIQGATGNQYVIAEVTAADSNDVFSVVVSDGDQTVTSRDAKLTVNTTNTAPRPTITSPVVGKTFRGGSIINFSGEAVDDEQTLNSSAYRWTIEYITGEVVRPFAEFDGVTGGSFDVPKITPYTAPDVKFRLTLTVADDSGAEASVSREITPLLSTITLASQGAAVPILLDGQPQQTPAAVVGVENIERTLEAPATHVVNGVTYTFSRWTDGGTRVRTIYVPIDDQQYTAVYVAGGGTPSTTLQAESGTRSGGTANSTQHPGYTGTGYADFGGQGSALQWTLSRSAAGSAALEFRYANGGTGNRPLAVQVNGATVGTLNFGPTGAWTTWATTSINVSLNSGNNVIKLVAATSAGGANVDSLTVVGGTTQPPPTGTASVRGYVIDDKNANGKWDNGEVGITGRTVWIDLDNDATRDTNEPTQMTGSNGVFNFTGLAAGTYKIRQVVPAGWRQTSPASNAPLSITLTAGQAKSGSYFGVDAI